MHVLFQSRFEEPPDSIELNYEPLVIHRRPERPEIPNNSILIIFVHGLGGNRYGEKATWGQFPRLVFEDFPELDVGLYTYPTLFGRLKFRVSVPLNIEAEVFADIIRDAKEYKAVVLVGHSMGGLLCMASICHLVNTGQIGVPTRIIGLILMATPQTGSQRVPKFLSWFSKDFYALRPHGAFVTHIHRTFVDSLTLDDSISTPAKTLIPTWAVLSASDFWVDKLSASIRLPANRLKLVHGSHTAIVKPQTQQADAYHFVRECVRTCLARSAKSPDRSAEEIGGQPCVQSNPFHTAGTLPANSSSYVERSCDTELMHLITEQSLIAVHGTYEIGKSSLLVRMQAWLCGNWTVLLIDLGSKRADNEAVFIEEFFNAVGEGLEEVRTWEGLAAALQRQRTVFLLDEFGALSPTVAGSIIPKLCWLTEKAGRQVRVIVALPEPIQVFLKSRGLRNPKYSRNWRSIHIPLFDEHEVTVLLRMLPESAYPIAKRYCDEIMRQSKGHPRKVQSLCARLFEQIQADHHEQELTLTIYNQESYK
jgi:pimeloyl-ACP methyl ester carboxylesterase